jgi:hypothetical protein
LIRGRDGREFAVYRPGLAVNPVGLPEEQPGAPSPIPEPNLPPGMSVIFVMDVAVKKFVQDITESLR